MSDEFSVQTRTEEFGGIRNHPSLDLAFQAAKKDPSIWKISFDLASGERVRLVKESYGWMYEDIYGNRQNDKV